MSLAIAYAMKKKKKKDDYSHLEKKHYAELNGRPVNLNFKDLRKPEPESEEEIDKHVNEQLKKKGYAEGGDVEMQNDPDPMAVEKSIKKAFRGPHFARGGMCDEHGLEMCEMCHGGKMAEGGFVHEEEESGYEPMPAAKDEHEGSEDIVGRILKHRSKHYSRGGEVANDTPDVADFEDNEFDDLVKDDNLHEHYTAKNSGDEIGDEAEDEDRHDIVKRIMRSRGKKDRMPHPM